MDQFDHGNLAIQLQKYQYSYIKPQAELRQLLLNVEDYNFLVEQIKDYDAMKLKRLLRFLKKKDNPQLIDLCLSKGVKIDIPLNQIDVKKNYHLQFISKQKSEDLRQNLLKRLKEEFIIDNKSKQVGFLQFQSQFTEILEFQDIAQLIDGAIKLTKRSDSNLDTLLKLLTQINIDISPIMNSIQEGLQEYLKNDIAIQCLQAAFKLVKDPAQLQQSFQYVQKLINTTMDDAKKIQYFNILNPREEIAGEQFKLALQISSVLQNEQQTFDLYNFIIKINYELKDVAQLKKLLSLNKFSTTLIQLLVADKLQKNKESTKELDELMVIISNNLSTNFKNFAKVVTQTVLFLSALKCAILYLHYWEEEGPGNLIIGLLEAINKNTEIFQSKSHLSQLKYLINPSCKEETVLFLECLFLHYAFINEVEAEYDGSLMPFILINSFQGKSQSIDIHPILQQAKQLCVRDDKIKFETIIDYLFQSFKQFLYQVNPNQQDFKKEKLNQFAYQLLRYVSGNVNQTVALCYSNALISQKLSQKLKAKQLEVDAIEILQQLQSYNQNSRQSYINYFVFLINNGYFDKLISQLLVFLDPNNLKTAKELPEPQDLENQDTSLLNRIGVQTLLDIKPLSQEEIQLQQELLKSKQKVMMMDENEVRVSNMKRHKEKLLKFYQLCLKLLTGSLQNKDVAQKLLEFFYDPISYFASEQDFRMEFVIFSVRLLRRFQLTQQYEWPISEFFLHRAQGTLPDEKVCTKIKQFYDNLKDIKQESIFKLIHYINLYIISQKSFEVSLKFRVFNFVIQYKYMINSYFQPFLQNINICAHAKNSVDLLKIIIKDQVFEDILNYVYEAQMCILKSIQKAPNDFAVQLKLRILQKQEEIAELTNQHVQELDINGLKDWNMTHFIEVSSREHVEFMIQILKQYNPAIFPEKICESAQQLLHKLDDEQLEFFPYFALTYQNIPTEIIPRIIDLLVYYTADEHRVKLVDLAQEAGIHLIKTRAKECAKEILVVLEKQLQNKHSSASICALVFLGILSPFIKAQNNLQKQILQLIQKSSQQVQYNLARCLPDLLSFFPDAPLMISDILANNKNEKDDLVRRGNCYLVAGLLRGLGVQELDNMKILNRIEKEAIGGKKETIQEKEAIVIQVQALIEIFGRLLEPYIIQVMGILMKYFGENKVQIRDIAINAARTIMSKMTSYGVKIMLPNLLQGLDADLQWRGKQANIQALGNMAYCSPKQISSRLPLIVCSISKAISDTHPEVRRSANESLNQIGSTIKNPEISSISDILILALSNPYDQNIKGLEVILQTKFNHYIDAPAMSLIIPLIDYAFRSQESKQKKYGAIVVGSLPLLLQKAEDLVPYMDLIIGGLEFVIGDPLVDVRTIAAQAIGQISKKIGIPNTKIFFKFIWDILENKEANSIKRSGAAHALAEMICIHDKDYFEDSMQFIYEQIQRPELHIKEGYIGTFIYIPTIKRDTFQDYVKDVLENIYDCVSHEEEAISSITLRVLKIIIKNYGVIQNELLYPALTEAMLNRDWKRRYAGVLLSGEMLRIALKIVKEQYDKPSSPQYINIEMYNQNLMMLYVCCQDIAEQVRLSADSLWKELIENTPRTVKRGLRQIARHLCQLIINIPQVAENTVSNFCQKYGNDNKLEFINHIRIIFIDETNLSIIRGGYLVLNSLYKYLDFDFLNNHRSLLIEISRIHLINQDPLLQQALFQSIGQMIIRIKSTIFVEELVEPYLEQLAEMDELDANYSKYLEIFNQLCQLNQPLILHYLVLLILVPPLHQYKIEILTNNAQTFGQVIYKKYDGTVPISFLFEDLFQNAQFEKDWDQRTISLLYCIGQLSVNLKIEPENYVQIFVKDILEQIEVRSRPIIQDIDVQKNYKYLLLTLEILQYFLQNSSEEYHAFNNDIIPKAIPYLFIQNPLLAQNQQDRLIKVCNKIIYDVNNHLKKDVHCENMKIIHTCFTNRKGLQIPGLNADEGIIPYQSMIIDTLIFGKDEYFRYAIDFINLLIDRAQPENLQQPLLKIVGALIRILHYKMSLENKYLALQTLEKALAIDLSQFNPQLLITYDKLIVEMNKIDHGLKQLSRNYSKLIRDHIKRDLILNQLFNKAIQGETTEIRECHLTIVKKILKDQTKIEDQLYSSAVLERIFILGKQYFDKCINEKKNHAGEFTQLGLILAVAYNYSSKQHKESYLQKQLILGQPNILLRLQFNRFNKFELQETRQYAEKELNQESVYARYIEKTLRKLK